jgi:hypothetical protein
MKRTTIASAAQLADAWAHRQVGRIGVQGLVDQLVGDVGPVELRGVDVVDAQFDCPTEHGERLIPVTRRTEHTGAG